MEGNTSIPKDSDILTTNEQKTNQNLNKTSIFVLTASIQTQSNKDIVFESSNTDISRGDSSISWKNIEAKYTKENSRSDTQLQNRFLNCMLTPVLDPIDWLTNMEKMRKQVEKTKTITLTDKGYRERIIENLPSNKYAMIKLTY